MRNPDDIFDELLVLRCQSGDNEAFVKLVDRWHPRMLCLAMRLLSNKVEAEDAVQSAWVVAIRKIGSLRDPAAFRPWVFRVVANKCADIIRKRQARRRREQQLEPESIEETLELESNAEEVLVASLRKGIQALDRDKRTVLRLYYLEGMSVEQIAVRLSLPGGTVKSRLHHARKKLRIILNGEMK